ncbi:uncharacterized protein LOC111864654 isoform X2 [Cryptotermes secundus]|uniref:uncharacterized protein LOC111864654 isoform X2 n=1 Tax=Cryptotermes secundus TaxID=105785 RepID=UPI001454D0CB|nr:uncharacterized protein LOC111864654 isoform X2 [Cryptotermes secundus]
MKTERQFTLYTHSFVTKLLIRANSGNISTHFQFFIVVVPLDSPGSNPGSFRVGLMVDNLAMRQRFYDELITRPRSAAVCKNDHETEKSTPK